MQCKPFHSEACFREAAVHNAPKATLPDPTTVPKPRRGGPSLSIGHALKNIQKRSIQSPEEHEVFRTFDELRNLVNAHTQRLLPGSRVEAEETSVGYKFTCRNGKNRQIKCPYNFAIKTFMDNGRQYLLVTKVRTTMQQLRHPTE